MSYITPNGKGFGLGHAGILGMRDHGRWMNAVDGNIGGTAKFVSGPWTASYGRTYGVDAATHTAWAVVNHGGSFAVLHDFSDLRNMH